MRPEHVNSGAARRQPSRNIVPRTACIVTLLLVARSAAGQDASDSLAIRLRRAENAIAVLQQQISEQAEGGVQTRSRARLELSGRVAVNGFGNSRKVNNVDNPQFVNPDPPPGVPYRGLGMSARQTRLGLAITGLPQAFGGVVTADMDVDFYGGQVASSGGRHFPLVRLRTARMFVKWKRSELLVGQETPLISDLNPVSPAAMGTPGFAAAGNLWLWLPQVRFTTTTAGATRVGIQAAVLAPTSGDPVSQFDTDNDQAERSMHPFLEGRAFVRWGEGVVREVGCGLHQGWLVPVATREESWAVACDARLPMNSLLELRGEFFGGQALRGLGGGGIGQNFVLATSEPLRTSGGWAQLNVSPISALRLGAGCGADHPRTGATRRRNDVCSLYGVVRPAGGLFFGAEVRRMRTAYPTAQYINDHVTIAMGFEF
jgi:hypothetical protein